MDKKAEKERVEEIRHSHPVLRNPGLPPKKVSRRSIVPIEEPSIEVSRKRAPRKGCCG